MVADDCDARGRLITAARDSLMDSARAMAGLLAYDANVSRNDFAEFARKCGIGDRLPMWISWV
jgi:hypothetical protein